MSSSALISRIVAAHERCKRGAMETVKAAVECGALLIELKNHTNNGDWGDTLATIGMKRNTAWNYMRAAERWDPKQKQLKDGIYLCNLLREPEFKLLPELQGGGNRLGKEELERRRNREQMVFHFDRVEPALDEVLSYEDNPIMGEPPETLEKVERGAKRLLQWAKEARNGEIAV